MEDSVDLREHFEQQDPVRWAQKEKERDDS
jgi:hypothetical protein